MQELKYRVSFTTPAFLGNAEQQAQWRTPPFKALLRQWWRVAYAAGKGFEVDIAAMRHEEGRLFGHAWLDDDRDECGRRVAARKSLVRMRLEPATDGKGEVWAIGTQNGVAPLSTGLDTSYAWFGLIKRGDGQPDRTAIKAERNEATRSLHIAIPEEREATVNEIMRLINAFGQLGSRSRGGWGSVSIDGIDPIGNGETIRYTRPIEACLADDWPMSLAGNSQGLLLWEGAVSYDTWDGAMRAVAGERKNVRTALKSVAGHDLRPALGFASPGRMPSPLRWKIIPHSDGRLGIRIFAMPHDLPQDSKMPLSEELLTRAWQMVCDTLDHSQIIARCNG